MVDKCALYLSAPDENNNMTMVGSPVVVIDIGASKIQCLIGEGLPDGENVRILGAGNSPCQGIRRNSVIDMPRVVQAIRDSVAEAERSAALKITGAFIGVGGGEGIEIQTSKSAVAVSGLSEPIDERDVQRAVAAAEQASPPCDGLVLHRFIQSYAVDDEPVHNPLWLHGNRLEVETLSAAASGNLCTTLERAVSEAGLAVAGFVLESVAIGRVLLSPEEREMGVGIVDFGAGTSDLAVYRGNLRHVAEIPFGGEDITRDMSVVLNISPRDAEQLKREHGCVCCGGEDEGEEPISFITTAGREHSLLRHQLSEIIEARQQEILEFVAREVRDSGSSSMLSAGMVFTGGGSLLGNLAQLGEEVFGVPVRVGAAQDILSAERMDDPRNTTAVGLLQFAAHGQADFADEFNLSAVGSQTGILNRISKLFSFL